MNKLTSMQRPNSTLQPHSAATAEPLPRLVKPQNFKVLRRLAAVKLLARADWSKPLGINWKLKERELMLARIKAQRELGCLIQQRKSLLRRRQ
ncbi:hypothetical protein [Chromatium okenii]|uniref:hypothetical protein n=1 Tax=Chromatium okenii TaxID=61644 RepID=UPI001F5BBFE1|nr:hypothetical protein [Chromatium okenii]